MSFVTRRALSTLIPPKVGHTDDTSIILHRPCRSNNSFKVASPKVQTLANSPSDNETIYFEHEGNYITECDIFPHSHRRKQINFIGSY